MPKKPVADTFTPQERELAIQLAVKDVQSGEKSYRQAEQDRGVPKSTIENRIKGVQSRQEAHADQQALYPAEEAEVCELCDEMQRRFLPMQLVHVVGYGEMILSNRLGTEAHLGRNWAARLILRHPELKLTTSKRIDERRVMAKNPDYVMEFYDLLSRAIQEYNLDPSTIFNMDEKGYMLGITGKEKVVIMTRDSRDGYAGGAKDYGNRETVTTIDCISADGTVLPPMIIMKGKYVLKQWSEGCPELNARWACSPNGWTDNELGVEYIKQFDAWTADRVLDGSWRCLILDGHGSHLTAGFLCYAYQARIVVLGLPSHTTDFLQPLDRVIFRVLQRSYGQEVREQMRKMLSVTKSNFGSLLYAARQKAYTTKNILSAFESTGISPFDPYRTPLMHNFRMRAQQAHLSAPQILPAPSSRPSYSHDRDVAATCREIAKNALATSEELRDALTKMVSLFDGAEARNTLLESQLSQMHEAEQARKAKKPRAGRVGRARTYNQAEIDQVRAEEEARDAAKASRATRKRGNANTRSKTNSNGRSDGG